MEMLITRFIRRSKILLGKEGAHLDGSLLLSPPSRSEVPLQEPPEAGLIEEAVKELDIDCSHSYMVGDRRGDIEFAHKVGAKGILVLTGYGRGEWDHFGGEWNAKPSYVAEDLL